MRGEDQRSGSPAHEATTGSLTWVGVYRREETPSIERYTFEIKAYLTETRGRLERTARIARAAEARQSMTE
jgi:hypothetical protein